MPDDSLASAARTLARRLEELARISEERGALTRTFLSPAMRRAEAKVADWMRRAGLETRIDAVGNLIGRVEAAAKRVSAGHPGRDAGRRPMTLILGSHLDTVRDAGR